MRSARDIKPLRRNKGLSSPHPECQSTPCKYGYILRQKETAWATLNSPKVGINMTTQQQPFNLNINSYIILVIIFMMIP